MKRREFLKKGSLWVPSVMAGVNLLLPRKSAAQGYLPHRRKAFRGVGGGGITFDSVSSAAGHQEVSSTSPKTYAHAIGALTNGYVVIGISVYTSRAISAVSFDGLAATQILSDSHSSDSPLRGELWGVALGTKGAGTYTVSITFGGSGDIELASASMAFSGVHQSASYGGATSAEGVAPGTPPSVAVTSATGEMVVDLLASYRDPNAVGAGQTERWKRQTGNLTTDGAGSTEPGAGSVTMSWSLTDSGIWTLCAVSLKPA